MTIYKNLRNWISNLSAKLGKNFKLINIVITKSLEIWETSDLYPSLDFLDDYVDGSIIEKTSSRFIPIA